MERMMTTPDTLNVVYKLVNGSHFFVGDDHCPYTTGLCVGNRDLKKAFDQVSPALQFLLKANHGVDAVCPSSMSFEEFVMGLLSERTCRSR
jgi:hypothetical protein